MLRNVLTLNDLRNRGSQRWLPNASIDARIAALRATVIRRASWRGLPWRLWRRLRGWATGR